ncbi:MAG: L-lactate dehydrogenase [Clostridia bacterium]|nr:L-lactate dehydrogenase [Clostridia bacterium]MBR7159526.1 L-lactate dehydrogenase [Clostridia bacterium]
MKNKVTIIGAGAVGSTIAYTLITERIASEIVMIDINKDKAKGEAIDIAHAAPFSGNATIYDGDYPDAVGSDIVVITSGVARKPGQTRLDLAQINTNIMKSIAPQIAKYAPNAIYVIVSNPVDVMTYVFAKASGIPSSHVIGSGTLLDTARLRSKLSELYHVNPEQIEANVYGEHGDSSFVGWSHINIAGMSLADFEANLDNAYFAKPEYTHEEIETWVRKSGGQIISLKGATYNGIASSVAHLCDCIFRDSHSVITVGTLMKGQFGVDEVYTSLLAVVGKDGVIATVSPKFDEAEEIAFRKSSDTLKGVIAQLEV